jgi:predicted RNase H-like HicB family nuclease
MIIPILIEPMGDQGFLATGGPPLDVSAQGVTREEALGRLREAIEQRMKAGAVLVPLEVAAAEEGPNPWVQAAGMFQDDPLFDQWQTAIAEYRREIDQDSDAP